MDNNNNSSECPNLVLQHFKEVYPVEQWKAEGFFENEDLLDIPCHWLGFEPTRPNVHYLLAVSYVIVFLVGFCSNTTGIYIIISSSKKLLTPTGILQINLAISDLVIVFTIPVFIFNSLHQGPAIGKFGCSLYGFLTGLSGTCSIMSITAISYERYLAICCHWKPTRRWAVFMSLLAWLYSTAFACLPFFGVGKYVPEGLLTGCSFDYLSNDLTTRIFILVFFIGAWMIPMMITIYSYLFIIWTVCDSRRNLTAISTATAISLPNVNFKVSKSAMGLISTWAVAWTPYAFVALIGISGYGHLLTPWRAMIPSLFAKLATCVDPFIYILFQPKIRTEILRPVNCSNCSRRMDSQQQRVVNNWRSTRSSPNRVVLGAPTEATVRSINHLGPIHLINNDTLYHERKGDEQHHSIQQNNLKEGEDTTNICVERSRITATADLNDDINKKVQSDDAIERCHSNSIDVNSSNEQSITDDGPNRIPEFIVSIMASPLIQVDNKPKETLI